MSMWQIAKTVETFRPMKENATKNAKLLNSKNCVSSITRFVFNDDKYIYK